MTGSRGLLDLREARRAQIVRMRHVLRQEGHHAHTNAEVQEVHRIALQVVVEATLEVVAGDTVADVDAHQRVDVALGYSVRPNLKFQSS